MIKEKVLEKVRGKDNLSRRKGKSLDLTLLRNHASKVRVKWNISSFERKKPKTWRWKQERNGTQGTLGGTSVCYKEDDHPLHVCAHAYKHTHTHTHHYTTVTGNRSSRLFMDPYYLIDLDQNPNRILTHTGSLNLSSSISKFASFSPHVSTFRPWHLIFSSYPAGALLSLFLTLSSL